MHETLRPAFQCWRGPIYTLATTDPVTVPVDAVLQLEPEHLDRSRKQAVEGLDPEKCVRDPAIWALRCGGLPCQFRLTQPGCQSKLTGVDLEELSANLSSDDPAIGLRASLALHRLAERVEANQVAAARQKGWSWQQIGDALGVTRQSVHAKYNKESS